MFVLLCNFVIATTSSISPTEYNISINTYNATLPVNGSIVINITSNETYDNISFIYNNITTLNESWISGPVNVSFDNQTEYSVNLDYTVPNSTSTGNYTQIVSFVHYDNTTENLTVNFEIYYNITINWSCNYTGNATFLTALQNLTYEIDLNTTNLSYTKIYNFAMCSEPGKVYSFMADDWLETPTNLTYDVNTSVMEFNTTLTIPEINLSSSIAYYEKSLVIYRVDFSKIINYDITIRNGSYVESNETIYNETWVLDLEDMTAKEFIEMMNSWDDEYKKSIPDYVVEYINNTEYQNVPMSQALMQRWIQEYNPTEKERLSSLVEEWKKKYGEEESDMEAMKSAYTAENKRVTALENEKSRLQQQMEDLKESFSKSNRNKAIFAIVGAVLFLGTAYGLKKFKEAQDYDW